MQVTEREVNGLTVVDLEGRFDFSSRREFKDTMERLQQNGVRHVVLNLDKVTFIDSSALGLLVVAHQNFKLRQGRISLAQPQTYVRQILDLANIPKMIPVFAKLDEALMGHESQAACARS